MSAVCPECVQGKHPNCTGEALTEDDLLIACKCETCNPAPEPEWCAALTFPGNYLEPSTYCENEAEPGSEWCTGHRMTMEED